MSDISGVETDSSVSSLVLARVGKTYGVKGWVRIVSYTSPETNILDYCRFQGRLKGLRGQTLALEMDAHKQLGNGLIAHFKGYDDPESAREITGAELAVDSAELPALPNGEFYWHQLQGLEVITLNGDCLGEVKELLETGANDVLVVVPNQSSVDDRERLIPYLPERVVSKVDLDKAQITVDWEADYLA